MKSEREPPEEVVASPLSQKNDRDTLPDNPLEQSEGPSVSDTDQNTDRLPEKKPEDAQKDSSKTPGNESKPEKKTATRNENKGTGKGLAGFALLISACALGLSGYIGWRAMPLEQSQPILREGMDQLQTQIARQQARLTTVAQNTSAHIEEQKEQLHELQEREARLLSRIDSLSTKVRELEGSTRNQWRIAEVEYLLRLANQRLLTVNDVTGALELMGSAEQILGQLEDYSLFPIREALAEDMAVLKSATILNQENIWLRLQAVADLIPELVILDDGHIADAASVLQPALQSGHTPLSSEKTDTQQAGSWQQTVKNMLLDTWHRFTGLFRINTQREQPVEVLLTPEQDQLIRQKMLLLIEQSKLALITGQQVVYQNSLEQAYSWLNRYFMLGGSVSNQLAEEFSALQRLSITSKMPSIHRSLDALKEHQFEPSSSGQKKQKNAPSPDSEQRSEPAIPDREDGKSNETVTEPDQPASQGVQIS